MIGAPFPKVEIVHSVNGNLNRIIQNTTVNINAVYTGSERVRGYSQLFQPILMTDSVFFFFEFFNKYITHEHYSDLLWEIKVKALEN